MEIKTVKISELRPHPKNPRVHPDSAIEKLERSIKEYGWTNPVLVSADGYVLAGHARLKAAEKAGISEVPVIYLPLEGAKAEAYLIADNRLQDETDWDYEKLKDLLQELDAGEFDLELTGFGMDEIEELMTQFHVPEEIVEDEVPEPPKEPITKPGDLWILGRHRLACGDSTKAETFSLLMDGKLANLVVTDPPYNVNYEGTAGKIKNDNMADQKFYQFLLEAFTLTEKAMAQDASIYVFHADTEGLNFRKAFLEAGFHLSGTCIWKKQSLVLGRSPYQWQHEPILFGWKKTGKHAWYSDRKQFVYFRNVKPCKRNIKCTYVQLSHQFSQFVLVPIALNFIQCQIQGLFLCFVQIYNYTIYFRHTHVKKHLVPLMAADNVPGALVPDDRFHIAKFLH
jgi:ParB-like chromosome segregation protein Spo0J